ncbi:molecular chaperone HscC [Candidatus Thiothrix sp. Deng01]|uniref:Molecular chaperone HscC n=1 Tax=Candidatus Thiothrix phosphatis TaxID=3112415 RepID=A0ABU6CVU7_9GAMM|nr:molecular chaperone HscC [Candidatus Thiothrix sp. Deng01]MEB4590967.1 molecular chaperone HscC [Candidatus Thiothrix sp. Deng01]
MTIIGIDLGTTNSACAVWKDAKVELIPNRLGDFLTPSVVHLSKDDTVLVGKTAQERLLTHPDTTASVFKRYMGTDRKVALKKHYTAPELSAFVLKSLKEDAETFLGEMVTEAVISVPAYFNNEQRKATILAGELAGLKVERLVNEPTAAAIAYGLHETPEHTHFMVVDLGGGTFDVSIMEYFEGVLEVHASAGDNFLGGEDFREVLVNHFLTLADISRKKLNSKDLQKVYAQMEQAKRQLNSADVVHVERFIEAQTQAVSIRRDDFIRLSEPLLQRIQRPIETALRDAKLRPGELDEVILVGGATRMHFFRSMIAKMFRRMPAANLDPDLVVAMGAAIQAGLKARDAALEDMVLTDICPYSLGVGTYNENDSLGQQGDLFSPILERNTIVPVSKVNRYVTAGDNQSKLKLEFYQGESRLVKNNIRLGELEIRLPKAKRGQEGADVRFSYDINGVLEVDVEVFSTGEKYYKMVLNTPTQLSERDIQASKDKLATLKFHPREDEANIALIARAERLYEGRLGYERDEIQNALRWFESVLERQDTEEVRQAREEFASILDRFEQDGLF